MAVNAITSTARGYSYDGLDSHYYYYDDDDNYYYDNDDNYYDNDDGATAYYGFSSATSLGLLAMPPALCVVALLVGAIAGFMTCARWKPTWGIAITGVAGVPPAVQVITEKQWQAAHAFLTSNVGTVIVVDLTAKTT